MLTSQYDQRHFRFVSLENGLRVLLVEDKQCKKSALAMTVNTGHFGDPEQCQGLAHLLEHMLFLGSEHFPESNGINHFLSQHGGNINAHTGTEYTSYYLDTPQEHLPEAAFRLADMLAAPLFNKALIKKELNAIDAEFRMKIKDDLRRLYEVHKETCNPAHPFRKFSVGNMQTLRKKDDEELPRHLNHLHQRHYIGANMCLCLISQQELKLSQHLIEHAFECLSSAPLLPSPPLPALYTEEQLAVQINIQPIKKARRLIVTFALPDLSDHYRSKPTSVLSHLLGDEGQGSLLAYLKKQNWANSLSAGGGIQGSNFKDFNLNLQLTESGAEHIDDILNSIFYLIEQIKRDGPALWRLKEKQLLHKLAFDFSDAIKPIDEALHLSNQMFHYPAEHIVAGDYLMDKLSEECIRSTLDYLSPLNMRLKVILPDIETDKVSTWYNTAYSIYPLPGELLKKLKAPKPVPELNLPEPNQYLADPQTMPVISPKYNQPKQMFSKPGFQYWFGQDDTFNQPRGDCFLSFDCHAVCGQIELITHKRLWVALMQDKLMHSYYRAGVAGLNFHLYPHQGGFSIQTNGFCQKQLDFCRDLLEQLQQPQDFEQRFEQVKHRQWQGLQNTLLNKPINRLFNRMSVILQRNSFAPANMVPVLQDASLEDIIGVQQKLFNKYHLECFVHGAWEPDSARQFGQFLQQYNRHHTASDRISRNVTDLRAEHCYVHHVPTQHDDKAIVIYYQAPTNNLQDVALTILLEQLLAAPFFSQLRTEKQLGYMVGTGYVPINQHPGISFYIQSPQTPVATLLREIRLFLHDSLAKFELNKGIWDSIKQAVIKQLAQDDTNLSMKSQRLWIEIGKEDFNFDYSARLIQTIQQCSFSQVKDYFSRMIHSAEFGELILYCEPDSGSQHLLEGEQIADVQQFKSNAKFIP